MIEIVRIPDERKSVVIGSKGTVKRKIEKRTETVVDIGDVVKISGEDPLMVLKAKDIVLAIARGFSPANAYKLLEEEKELHVISLDGETVKKRQRLVGRVIGRDGATKKRIEQDTGAAISIQGKTLSIIGTFEELGPAEEAVAELLSGKTHSYAYKKMNIKKSKMI